MYGCGYISYAMASGPRQSSFLKKIYIYHGSRKNILQHTAATVLITMTLSPQFTESDIDFQQIKKTIIEEINSGEEVDDTIVELKLKVIIKEFIKKNKKKRESKMFNHYHHPRENVYHSPAAARPRSSRPKTVAQAHAATYAFVPCGMCIVKQAVASAAPPVADLNHCFAHNVPVDEGEAAYLNYETFEAFKAGDGQYFEELFTYGAGRNVQQGLLEEIETCPLRSLQYKSVTNAKTVKDGGRLAALQHQMKNASQMAIAAQKSEVAEIKAVLSHKEGILKLLEAKDKKYVDQVGIIGRNGKAFALQLDEKVNARLRNESICRAPIPAKPADMLSFSFTSTASSSCPSGIDESFSSLADVLTQLTTDNGKSYHEPQF
jgi:hypothetical protein